MTKIKNLQNNTPDKTDKLVGTDEKGESKNFILEKLAEFFTGFFQNNNTVDWRVPQAYPDNSVIENNKINLDKVVLPGNWHFVRVLSYFNGTKEIPAPMPSFSVEVFRLQDPNAPNNPNAFYIKQIVTDYLSNEIYVRTGEIGTIPTTEFSKVNKTVI